MEYLYGLLFGTEPKQSDADATHALHAKLEALPDDRDAQITLTAAELRILKEATTTAAPKTSRRRRVICKDAQQPDRGPRPVNRGRGRRRLRRVTTKTEPARETKAEPRDAAAAQGVQNAVADLISERQLASSVPKERRKTLEAALSEVNAWGFDVWSVVDAFQGCVEIKFRAPHAIDAMLTHW